MNLEVSEYGDDPIFRQCPCDAVFAKGVRSPPLYIVIPCTVPLELQRHIPFLNLLPALILIGQVEPPRVSAPQGIDFRRYSAPVLILEPIAQPLGVLRISQDEVETGRPHPRYVVHLLPRPESRVIRLGPGQLPPEAHNVVRVRP